MTTQTPENLLLKYQADIYPLDDHQFEPPINIFNYENAKCVNDFLQYTFLYVIFNKNTLLYKIGVTNNIKNRFTQLKNQSGCNLHLVFEIRFECGYDENKTIAEAYLHNYFKDKRRSGEWFNLDARDLVQIRRWADETLEIYYYPINSSGRRLLVTF